MKYFITPYAILSGGQPAYHCRIVQEDYKEVYVEALNENEKDLFEQIMDSDKFALLYRKHKKLGKAAYIKIDYHEKIPISNAVGY